MIEIVIKTAVWACTDEHSVRYALSGLKVIPRTGGGAWLVGTDGRCLSITPVEGVCDEVSILPASLVKNQIPLKVSLVGGEWRSSKNRVEAAVDGKFPDIGEMLSKHFAEIDGQFEQIFNPSLLLKIRNAIQDKDGDAVRTFTKDVESGIAVLAGNGIGILMPMNANGLPFVGGKRDVADRTWKARAASFISDWRKAHPQAKAEAKEARKRTPPKRKKAPKKATKRKAASKK